MEQNKSNNHQESSDEIDLGQLFHVIGRAFQSLFKGILRFFLYIKRKAIILASLIILGLLIGVGLKQFVEKRKKIEVIVQPNLESKNYLYDAVEEVQANLEAMDSEFFKEIGLDTDLTSFEITVERIGKEEKASEEETAYLEMLLGFENSSLISDVVRAEVLNNTSFNHKITFYFKNSKAGKDFAEKIINYLNSNEYYSELVNIEKENSEERIRQNQELIEQIDGIIKNYSEKMSSDRTSLGEGQIMLDNEKPLDITGLFNLKNSLIRDSENKRKELLEKNEPIKVINFGKPQQVRKVLFARYKLLIPLIFLGVFFMVELIRYLNKKAKEL